MAYKVSFGSYQHSGSLQATVDITGSTTVSGAVGNFGTLTVSSFSPANISSTNITASSNMSASTANFGTLTVETFSPANISSTNITASSNMSASTANFGTLTVETFSPTNLTIAGNLIVSGNTVLGDNSTDRLSVQARIQTNLIPTGTVDLGGVGNLWTNIYASSISASSTLQAGGLASLNGGVNSTNISGSGALQAGGIATIGNGLVVTTGGATITGTVAVSGAISSTGNITSNGAISSSLGVQAGTNISALNGRVTAQTLTASVGSTLGATLVTSLSSSGNVIVGGDLTVQGTTTTVNSTVVEIKDSNIIISSGSTTSLLANGSGLTLGSTGYQFNFQSSSAGTSTDFWQVSGSTGLTDFKAKTVFATVDGNVTQQTTNLGDADGTLSLGINYSQADFTGPHTWTLPASPSVGQSVKVKAPHNCDVTNTLTVSAGAKAIDFTGNTTVVLASPDAALELVYVDSANNLWKIF